MKNLVLVRHAKSSWEDQLNDIDRPLDSRGISDAQLVAIHTLESLPSSYMILSSIARRARETALLFAKYYNYPSDHIQYMESLYTFEETALERTIRLLDSSYNNVILFGHNEAITNFVNKFGDIFIPNVPTAGFVSIHFDEDDWQTISAGKTVQFSIPKDLK